MVPKGPSDIQMQLKLRGRSASTPRPPHAILVAHNMVSCTWVSATVHGQIDTLGYSVTMSDFGHICQEHPENSYTCPHVIHTKVKI
jgi:hypothetical protein